MTQQRRAQAGGEVGANGEWYEGGKFIATTDHAKGKPAPSKPAGRQQYEPYKWAVAPEPGQRALLVIVGSYAAPIWEGRQWTKIKRSQAYLDQTHFWGYEIAELITMWNNGTRWVMPK